MSCLSEKGTQWEEEGEEKEKVSLGREEKRGGENS
jgi:hypothetical protein